MIIFTIAFGIIVVATILFLLWMICTAVRLVVSMVAIEIETAKLKKKDPELYHRVMEERSKGFTKILPYILWFR
ncbi:hypothetical protein [Butyrivibrio hungatei]|uniref:Uncharacterized protein n=1 Tax=Butyrivibrio hungatei TaxID=185008 RepID=A0A1D9NZI6_9FIRM|nr:hypothetical protein [Butyrivibrio hungatei]AOZ95345.1 hypothetical protein bhn_I0311 [Butyrivibrio hungatei]